MAKLSKLSMNDLLAEVKRRQKTLRRLLKQRAKIQKTLAAVESQIETLNAAGASQGKGKAARVKAGRATRTRRPKNKMSLMEALLKAMPAGKAMSIPEIVTAVAQKGYRSNSAKFSVIVGQTLGREPDKFKRLARGQYALAE